MNISPCHYAEGSCANQLASYVMGIRGSSLGSEVARARRKNNHGPPPSQELKNGYSYTNTTTYVFMEQGFISKHTTYLLYVYVWPNNKFMQPVQVIQTFLG